MQDNIKKKRDSLEFKQPNSKRTKTEGEVDSEEDFIHEIPEPNIYFGDDIKKYHEPIYEKVPAFTIAWLLRLLYYKYRKFKYVTKQHINSSRHSNLRACNLKVKFGFNWIWHAIWHMIDVNNEELKKYRLIEWYYDDDTPEEQRNKPILEGERLPSKIRLTDFGKYMAEKLGQGRRGHKEIIPNPEERLELEDEENHLLEFTTYRDYPDLIKIMEDTERSLNELAILRRRQQQQKHQQQQQLFSESISNLETVSHNNYNNIIKNEANNNQTSDLLHNNSHSMVFSNISEQTS
jgi:hypothetical protein